MKSLLMTTGMFLMLCGGEFIHIGSAMARAIHMTIVPDYLPYVVVAIGAGLIIECAIRTSPN